MFFSDFFELKCSNLISGQRDYQEKKKQKNSSTQKDFCQLINTLILNLK